MRVLMTTDCVGGVWTYCIELCREMQVHGVSVELAVMGSPLRDPHWSVVRELPNVRVHEGPYRLEWEPHPWADVDLAAWWLLDLENRTRPDVIHLNNYGHGDLPWRAPTLVVGHSCVLSWWRAVKGGEAPGEEWSVYRARVRAGLAAADAVVAPSEAMRNELQSLYGPLPRTVTIHNGCRIEGVALERREGRVLSAGRFWDEAKNLASLHRAADGLEGEVCVAGDDRGAPPSRDVIRLGPLDRRDLLQRLRAASVYALPARYEPFGLSALEAAMCGCALILGDIPSLREVWGEAAVFVPPDDPAALTHAANRLLHDPAQRHRWAAAAGERARRYAAEAMAGRYVSLYHHLLRDHFGRGRSRANGRRADRNGLRILAEDRRFLPCAS